MATRRITAFPILLSIVVVWVVAVPVQLQAGANALRRDMYGPATTEFLGGQLDDHGPSKQKILEDQDWDRTRFNGDRPSKGSSSETKDVSKDRTRYYQSMEKLGDVVEDRLERNLDQIGGGNLLRRGLHEREYDYTRWLGPRGNLDQIGGGNLLREVDDRVGRNLDQIGGGNLVRGLNDVVTAADNLRRNLDQIGGGNLVRELAQKLVVRDLESRPQDANA
ncbi:uncharacterized protein LOC143348016 isoform X1 [Colletes latitarsis]|uniref:uncharacterized protein LOC143348016 isoform X1 n=2 Tax=Colletes latitarsis TaxID=2605962 RepID=UPI004035CA4F